MTYAGLTRFAETYGRDCVDWGAHDVDSGSMWYYYRPARHACEIAAGDVVEAVADVTPSEIQTTGRFPEYDMVWADDALRVVAVFGKYEDGASTSADAGIAGYNRFLREIARTLGEHTLVTDPAESDLARLSESELGALAGEAFLLDAGAAGESGSGGGLPIWKWLLAGLVFVTAAESWLARRAA